MALRSLALCAGIGGLDLGVKIARPDHQLICAVERQAFCAAVLMARMDSQDLDPCPIWDDIESFDGFPWRGCVDLVTAGFPCQPHSVAGKRLGMQDERWLWDPIWRTIRAVRPKFVFMENVPGLVSTGGLARILGDMACVGMHAEWDLFPASAVGAPHKRERVFILAADSGCHGQRSEGQSLGHERGDGTPVAGDDGSAGFASDSHRDGCEVERGGRKLDPGKRQACGHDADGSGAARGGIPGEPADPRGNWDWQDAPEPSFRRVDDGLARGMDFAWPDRIHALGNAVVPQQAAHAWRVLWERLHSGTGLRSA